jgi:hypothetical protein
MINKRRDQRGASPPRNRQPFVPAPPLWIRSVLRDEAVAATNSLVAAADFLAFWEKHLRTRGYRIRFQIVDWPNGLPGDIGVTLSWG